MSLTKAPSPKKAILRAALCALLPAAVMTALFCFSFFMDNKYRAALPGGSGYNIWDSRAAKTGYGFLVDGWEYYPGRLLLPGQFGEAYPSPAITYIGEHSNFSADLGTPYGCATYRLTLRSEEPSGMLALYLPELPSAAEVYINGRLAGASGELTPYSPLISDRIYPFMSDGETEIVIRAANYSHYYGGLYYPPAVGDAGAVYRLQGIRLLVYGVFCFSALALGIFHIGLWIPGIGRRDAQERRTELLFGILCLSFAAGKAYPFLLLFGVSQVRLFLAFQDFLGAVVIFCATALTLLLAGRTRAGTAAVPALEASMAAVCAVFPLFILPHAPALINGYGTLVSCWKLLTAGFIFAVSLRALAGRREPAGFLLAASTLYGSCLLAEVLTINRLEPVCGMWMEEYGCFFMAAAFGLLMAKRSVKTARENEYLYDNLQREVERKTEALTELLGQRRQFLAEVVHDLKTPLTAIKNYAVLIKEADAPPDEETRSYLKAILERMEVFDGRLSLLRDYSAGERTALKKEAVELGAFLTEFYDRNLPDIESAGHTFALKLPENGRITVWADRQALWRVLENLCYNSLSFMETGGLISLSLFREGQRAVVAAADSGSGIPGENLPHIFERDFTCRKDNSGEGLGLYIARSLILEHGGDITAQSEKGGGTVFTITLPVSRADPECR